ncbi:ATP-binding protein [Thermomonospora amylolytica]|uniref:ATP-binding protein n=1 Tax=Thermomonospora amylolytica TaxID=1411117 RepID=UPI000E6C99F7|nr:LuxR C-terminal-related transcriptional regulator [Thermomonospora amylolytica]
MTEGRAAGGLPAEITRFIGRRRELADVTGLLGTARLVTLTGVGGVGKTRLALRAAHQVRRNFPDGVRLVELSGLREPGLVCHAVGHALQVQDHTPRALPGVLAGHLADREMLLVLDTCEHLVDACAELAESLLQAAPGLRVLATSREPLNAAGEQVYPVAPLPVPDEDAEDLDGFDSVRLFMDRATAADPSFALTPENRRAVARVCAGLEGIPLALELAAARLRVLSAAELGERIGDRFQLLGTRGRTGPSRHRTLRAAVGWSHELCDPAEKLLWARLSVFVGTFDLTAVRKVCADGKLPAAGMFDLVAALVDKSVVVCERHPDGSRLRMLETLREYGAEWLRSLGEEEAVRRRHRDHYLQVAQEAERRWFGPEQEDWLRRLRREHHNFRAALESGLDAGQARAVQRMATALQLFWATCGPVSEGRMWLERALELDGAPPESCAEALTAAGAMAILQGDRDGAARRLAEAQALAGRLDDPWTSVRITYLRGLAATFDGRPDEAIGLLREAQERFADLGVQDASFPVQVRLSLATAHVLRGEPAPAIAYCRANQRVCREHGDRTLLAYALAIRARAELASGEVERAAAHLRQAVRLRRAEPDPASLGLAVELLAWIAAARGEPRRGAVLLGAAHRLWWTFGLAGLRNTVVSEHAQCERRIRDALGESAFRRAHQEGAGLSPPQIAEYALADQAAPAPAAPAPPDRLTPRERQVAALVAEGLSNRQIAERLTVAKRTVDTHVEHILAKLDFTARTQIAAWYARQRPDPEG